MNESLALKAAEGSKQESGRVMGVMVGLEWRRLEATDGATGGSARLLVWGPALETLNRYLTM